MTAFERNTFQIFYPILSDFGFRKALSASGSRRAALVAKINNAVCAYVFVTDGRPSGASVDVDTWIAPADFPGDSIDKLGVGIKIGIASSFEIDDVFMKAAALKVSRYAPHFERLAETVSDELAAPSMITQRMKFYKLELEFVCQLESYAKKSDPKLAAKLELLSNEAVSSGKNAYERLEIFLSEVVHKLEIEGELLLPQALILIPPQARGGLIAGHYYMKALLK